MREGRRTFLGKTLAGLGALAGLAIPGRVLAWHRRQRGCPCDPTTGRPILPTDSFVQVHLNYPPDSGVNIVYGGGGFYAWGYFANTLTISGASISGPGIPPANPIQGKALTAPTPSLALGSANVFAFEFDKVPTDPTNQLTLTVYYGSGSVGDTATIVVQ